MRPFALTGITLFLTLFRAGSALAQMPALLPSDAPGAALPIERDATPTAPAPPLGAPPSPRWSLDLLVGLPTGLRVQRRLGESACFVEGVAALYVILPMLGGGFRHCCTLLSGENNALCLSPGIDAYLLEIPSDGKHHGGLLTGDVDILWRHTYGKRWQGDLGVKLGAGAAVFGRSSGGVLPAPVVCLFGGLRF
jgi:hypothetical protein